MSLTDVFTRAADGVGRITSVGMSPNGALIQRGRMSRVPCHMSELPWLVTEGPCAADVAAVLVGPPDADGWCSLGVSSDYIWPAVRTARLVPAEFNDNVPTVAGNTQIHVSAIAAAIARSRPQRESAAGDPNKLELAIGVRLPPTRTTVAASRSGSASSARPYSDRSPIAATWACTPAWSETRCFQMCHDGIVTNRRKAVDQGLTVAGSILGSGRALALAASDPNLTLRSIEHSNDPAVIGQLDDFVRVTRRWKSTCSAR
jgi:acyl-CoA hydrolase